MLFRVRLLLLTAFLFATLLPAQTPAAAPAPAAADIYAALVGHWTGLLEYRDYSEPPASLKRVQLPTWLTVSAAPAGLTEHFVYDDGPNKTVDSTQLITFTPTAYTETEPGKPTLSFQLSGFDKLKAGRGELILLGHTTDNNKPAESRITFTLRRNLLAWLEEVRVANSSEPFAFRHRYTFVRADAPAVTSVTK